MTFKNATDVDASGFAKKDDLANQKADAEELDIDKLKIMPSGFSSFKSKVDKLDVSKLIPVPVELIKQGNVVKNNVVKKTEYDELVKKVNAIQTIDTSDLFQRKLTATQKLMILKKTLLVMITVNILLLKNLTRVILQQD